MNHKEKMQLAQGLCDRFVGVYSADVIIGGVYGSVARGLDTQWSDLEMLFVTRDGCKAQGQHLVYRGTAVSYFVTTQGRLEKLLANPSLEGDCGWPFWMGVLSVLQVLYGQPTQINNWLQIGKTVPDEEFKKALARELPGLIRESYGRILSCKERNKQDDLYCAVLEVLFEMKDALCLLNRSWVTHDYLQGLRDSFQFPKLPKRYQELVVELWHAHGFDEILPRVNELTANFWRLMKDEGIDVQDYTEVKDIQI